MKRLTLRRGWIERAMGGGWFALCRHEFLRNPQKFNHLGEALAYLGYKAVPPRAHGKGGS